MKKTILALCLILCIIAGACTALADAMTFRDEDGNVLEQGASLSGKFYYRVYVEGVAEDCEAIQANPPIGEPNSSKSAVEFPKEKGDKHEENPDPV